MKEPCSKLSPGSVQVPPAQLVPALSPAMHQGPTLQVKVSHFSPTAPFATPRGFWHLSSRASNKVLKMAYKEALWN